MIVRDFLKLWSNDINIKILQHPIAKIDKCKTFVLRQVGTLDIIKNSNQNYLDYEIVNLQKKDDYIIIICKANEEQEKRTINAYQSKK